MVWNLSEANKLRVVVCYEMFMDEDDCCAALGKLCEFLTEDMAAAGGNAAAEGKAPMDLTLVCT